VTGEVAEKRRRVLALLDALDLDAVVLRRPGNVAWFSGGGRTYIVATPDVGVADVVVTRDGVEVVTAVNEAPRLEAEELGGIDASFRVLAWSDDRVPALPAGPRVGADSPLPGTRDVSGELEAARRSLTDDELDRYRSLGRDAATALTTACLRLTRDTSEFDAAGLVTAELYARGADAIVLLVAGDERLSHHRHPLPTSARLGRLAMLVVCARRGGLIANLTRFVAFEPLRDPERDAYERLLRVDVAFNAATVPGRAVGDVFAAGAAAYAANGFDADEWRLHHQGGPTGYEARDYLATAESAPLVERFQAFAWNPSVPSLKSEDTIVAGAGAPEILTVDDDWPACDVDGLRRPLVVER
jgi:Xaa-Pro aminopeptidase